MNTFLHLFSAVSLVAFSSCSTLSDSDLALNGVIESGWRVSNSHNWMGGIPSEVFADANSELDTFINKLTDGDSDRCLLVPQVYGYDVVILTHKRLSDRDEKRVRAFVDTAISQAQTEAKKSLRNPQ